MRSNSRWYCLRKERTEYAKKIRKKYDAHEIDNVSWNDLYNITLGMDEICNTITTVQKDYLVLEEREEE